MQEQTIQDAEMSYVIYSPNESALTDGSGFWNNENGWVEFSIATRFSEEERKTFNLPISSGNDAQWALWYEDGIKTLGL